MEIERKFIVHNTPFSLDKLPYKHLIQGYLSTDPEVRIRCEGENSNKKYYLTVKSEGQVARQEYDTEITEKVYRELVCKVLNNKSGLNNFIEKDRYTFPLILQGRIAELDVYSKIGLQSTTSVLEHLKVVEVEFKDRVEAKNFIIPEWFGAEVTNCSTFKNKNLVPLIGSNIAEPWTDGELR
jgi:CYTH domain-containing protein